MDKVKGLVKEADKNILGLLIISICIIIVMGIIAPNTFLSVANFQSMGSQFPEFGILAFGMMLAMMSGGIDLSLVGIANLSGIICAVTMLAMDGSVVGMAAGIVVAIIVGMLCGATNGFLIGYLKIPPMLVTLCGLQLYTGIGVIITKGPAITGLPESFALITNGTLAFIPIPVIIFIIVVAVLWFIMKSTTYGKELVFMGSNSTASKYAGIDNLKVTMTTYILSGILGSIGGILIVSHYNSAKSDYGTSYTLLTLLIAVLGGTHPEGGKGKVMGVALAIIALQLVSSALNILKVSAFIKTAAWGFILIAVIVTTQLIESKKTTR